MSQDMRDYVLATNDNINELRRIVQDDHEKYIKSLEAITQTSSKLVKQQADYYKSREEVDEYKRQRIAEARKTFLIALITSSMLVALSFGFALWNYGQISFEAEQYDKTTLFGAELHKTAEGTFIKFDDGVTVGRCNLPNCVSIKR